MTLSVDALDVLSRIGSETSLRYSINLIATANLVAKRRKASEVDVVDVRRVYGESKPLSFRQDQPLTLVSILSTGLFFDEKRSVAYLQEHAKEFMLETDDFGGFDEALPGTTTLNGALQT